MIRTILALVLACLTLSLAWAIYLSLVDYPGYPHQILVYYPAGDEQLGNENVKAIENLHLPSVIVHKVSIAEAGVPSDFKAMLIATVVCAVVSGLVLLLYKLYSRLLR